MREKKTFELNKNDVFFFVCFALVGCFVLWRCKFGFAQSDESFYLAVPLRMYKGDALIANEWHLSQLTAFVYYPVVKLFIDITGSVNGLIIFVRYVYAVLHILSAAYIYIRLRRFDTSGAGLAAVIFMLFTPNSMSTLYYFTIGIMCNTLCYVTVSTAKRGAVADYVFSGLLFAAAVLCCPYLVIEFIVLVTVYVYIQINKNKECIICRDIKNIDFFTSSKFLCFLSGIAVLAIIFLVYIIRYVPLEKIFASVQPMLIDKDHPTSGFFKIIVYFGGMVKYNNIVLAVAMTILFLEMIFIHRFSHRFYYISAAVITVLMQIYLFINHSGYINYLMFTLSCIGLFCVLLSEDIRVKHIFYTIYIPGIMYSFCLNLASNQGFAAVSTAFCVPSVASAVIIAICAKELLKGTNSKKNQNSIIAATIVLFAVQIFTQAALKYNNVYLFADVKDMTEKADYGIMQGVYMSPEQKEDYDKYYKNVEVINNNYNSDDILCVTLRSCYYLMFDKEFSTYSPWTNDLDEEMCEKLEYYYAINPEKIPNLVFVDGENEYFINWFNQNYPGYKTDKYDFGYIMTK